MSKDITSTMSQILDMLFTGVSSFFTYLDAFEFYGITLLEFCLNIFLIGAFIPLILTLIKVEGITTFKEHRSRSKAAKRAAADEKSLQELKDNL